ncbi:MAG TPA: hypothetical protein VFG13_19000 [Blastococcus sp.]|nr:hypothetical protein [Blastococcus sp.]
MGELALAAALGQRGVDDATGRSSSPAPLALLKQETGGELTPEEAHPAKLGIPGAPARLAQEGC